MKNATPGPKSFGRMLLGVLAIVSGLVALPIGFVLMVSGLQNGAYGTPAMGTAFAVLGAGGGLASAGIALLIWEMSVRYGVRR